MFLVRWIAYFVCIYFRIKSPPPCLTSFYTQNGIQRNRQTHALIRKLSTVRFLVLLSAAWPGCPHVWPMSHYWWWPMVVRGGGASLTTWHRALMRCCVIPAVCTDPGPHTHTPGRCLSRANLYHHRRCTAYMYHGSDMCQGSDSHHQPSYELYDYQRTTSCSLLGLLDFVFCFEHLKE